MFACGNFHNHASKGNQTAYPWSQCIVAIGLLKKVQSRWACLPLDFRFYIMKKDILAKSVNVKRKGKAVSFKSKMEQAADMIKDVQAYYQKTVLVVTDSWFGNNGLWAPLKQGADGKYHLLSRI
ncbi:transposase [Desulfogranum japonicum]|uniref:transposase n=1 Tax=Desulfogranum japonicum TaxID=231447 RepID=UPI000A0682F0|nr:transposase [Desulfogranum japonicum]